jgi:uncharacterized protein (DUF305 family)
MIRLMEQLVLQAVVPHHQVAVVTAVVTLSLDELNDKICL